jgi:hypothetical protein
MFARLNTVTAVQGTARIKYARERILEAVTVQALASWDEESGEEGNTSSICRCRGGHKRKFNRYGRILGKLHQLASVGVVQRSDFLFVEEKVDAADESTSVGG